MQILEQKKLLDELVSKLISLGEDKDELWFWREFFDSLDGKQRKELLDNLSKEVKDLENCTS